MFYVPMSFKQMCFFLLPKLDIDIQNPRSVRLKKMLGTFMCKSPHWDRKGEEKKKEKVAASREETAAPASLRAGEVLLPAALPRTDVTQQILVWTIP